MGNGESALRASAIEAEGTLLRSGIDFAACQPGTAADIGVTALDVPVSVGDGGGETIRTAVWAASTAPKAINGTSGIVESPGGSIRDTADSAACLAAARTAVAAATSPPVVLVHGYGAGLGFYSHSGPLLARPGQPVFAVDMPGCGLSSRPPNAFGNGPTADIDGAEDYFASRLDAWRRSLGIKRMVLVGHSLGGYVAAAYAEKHPESLDRLVLAGCAGIPEPPEERTTRPQPGFLRRQLYSAWDRGWSPMALARWGPGSSLLGGYVDRRFPDREWVDKSALKAYLHSSWLGGPSGSTGEVAHSIFLRPGAYARRPLCHRLIELDPSLRITFIYGRHDWMDWHHGAEVDDRCRRDNSGPGPASRPATEVAVLEGAGHQLMVDNAPGFADLVARSATRDAIHGVGISR